ncbi:hypothetical protein GCM10023195_14040 [Actinoallomurus liliacearum]|uniref:Uncharacterized protein n=1 Tax=Actinoallomurus liliacearum TaxID=1080073 RepID=A0ABP8TC69_9ACTN
MTLHENTGADKAKTRPAGGTLRDLLGGFMVAAVAVALPVLALVMCQEPGHVNYTCTYCSGQFCSLCDGHPGDGSCIS